MLMVTDVLLTGMAEQGNSNIGDFESFTEVCAFGEFFYLPQRRRVPAGASPFTPGSDWQIRPATPAGFGNPAGAGGWLWVA